MIAGRIAGPAPSEAPPPEDEGASLPPPSESDEAAYLAGVADGEEAPTPAPKPAAEISYAKDLPELDTLVGRIPPGVREQLEDLFRARFSKVVRVSEKALKEVEPSK